MRTPTAALALLCVSACASPAPSSNSATSTPATLDATIPTAAASTNAGPAEASSRRHVPCLDDDEAVCSERCKTGEIESCVRLGRLYQYGNANVQADVTQARAAFARACDKGWAKACFFLGASLELPPKDEANAKRATDQGHAGMPNACDAEDAESCSLLADMYLTGTTVPKNKAKEAALRAQATKLYGEACHRGDGTSCASFGSDLLIAKQKKEGAEALQIGCNIGDPMSCALLGGCYDEGAGVTEDKAKAKGLFEKACKGGSEAACSRLK